MAKTDKELAVELAIGFIHAAIDKEKASDSGRFYFLQLNSEKLKELVHSAYEAIHALPEDSGKEQA